MRRGGGLENQHWTDIVSESGARPCELHDSP